MACGLEATGARSTPLPGRRSGGGSLERGKPASEAGHEPASPHAVPVCVGAIRGRGVTTDAGSTPGCRPHSVVVTPLGRRGRGLRALLGPLAGAVLAVSAGAAGGLSPTHK